MSQNYLIISGSFGEGENGGGAVDLTGSGNCGID
jgi:hypothetical protein